MRFVVAILGILGALGAAFLGSKWLSDLGTAEGQLASALADATGQGAELAGLKNAAYSLLVCAAVGFIVSIMVALRKGNKMANAVLLIVVALLPLIFSTKALFGVPMALAGLFAFGVKYEPKA
jgi:hypothetical protein